MQCILTLRMYALWHKVTLKFPMICLTANRGLGLIQSSFHAARVRLLFSLCIIKPSSIHVHSAPTLFCNVFIFLLWHTYLFNKILSSGSSVTWLFVVQVKAYNKISKVFEPLGRLYKLKKKSHRNHKKYHSNQFFFKT